MIFINIIGLYQFLNQAKLPVVSPATETCAERRNFVFFIVINFHFFSFKFQLKIVMSKRLINAYATVGHLSLATLTLCEFYKERFTVTNEGTDGSDISILT